MNRILTLRTLVAIGFLTMSAGCGGGGGGGGGTTRDRVTGVRGPDGAAATYHAGDMPPAVGAVQVTLPDSATAINGGSTMISVQSSSDIIAIYVAIDGQSGYWEVTVSAGTTIADVLLTLAQQLPPQIRIVFEVVDSAGNVSAPETLVTTIVQVKTGDVQISVSWDVDNDIDLHVVDPNQFEIYYAADLSPEGGELDLDSNAACVIDSIRNENVLWPVGQAPHGMYTVRVDNYDNCAYAAAHFVVTIQKRGQAAQTFMDSFDAADLGDLGELGAGKVIATFTYP
ncbi:MAG TPA: hypothetical protein VIF57_03265 [Polyangia bacterium]|jgi:hypothetical protein